MERLLSREGGGMFGAGFVGDDVGHLPMQVAGPNSRPCRWPAGKRWRCRCAPRRGGPRSTSDRTRCRGASMAGASICICAAFSSRVRRRIKSSTRTASGSAASRKGNRGFVAALTAGTDEGVVGTVEHVRTDATPTAAAAHRMACLDQFMSTSRNGTARFAKPRPCVVRGGGRNHKKIGADGVILSAMILAALESAPVPPTAAASPAELSDWLIFGIVYLGIAVGTIPFTRLSRAAIALLGAIAVVALRRLDFSRATEFVIDWTTLALLFALMLLSASLRVSGFYTRIIRLILDHAHKPWTLLIGVVAASALLSAIFANDIICLAFTPVLAMALRKAGKNPMPYLIALATSSNIGSAATIIGNPQNMLIGQSAKLASATLRLVVTPLVAGLPDPQCAGGGVHLSPPAFPERTGDRALRSGAGNRPSQIENRK